MRRRPHLGLALCLVLPAGLVMSMVEQALLARGVLDTKDLPPFVGDEAGSLGDHLRNVWHWDAAALLLVVLGLPCLVVGLAMLRARPAPPAGPTDP